MKIAVLSSGGVDSSVVLKKMFLEGHQVEAYYLRIWLDDELHFLGDCPWEKDLSYLREITKELGIPLHIISLQEEYKEYVIKFILEELRHGATPSPDILCNQYIKFGAFFDYLKDKDFDKIASGHYAQIIKENGEFHLYSGVDSIKDQSYFLSNLSEEQLKKIIFPLGGLNKKEVRSLAIKYDLPNKDRKDSQGICFLGKINYNSFVKIHLKEKKGEIINFHTGEVMGEHLGIWFYTIGQRKGLGLHGGPWFVVDKNLKDNKIYISHKKEKRDEFVINGKDVFWINKAPKKKNLLVKLRHGEKKYSVKIIYLDVDSCQLELEEGDSGIAIGQSVVFYDDNRCLGRMRIT